MTRICVSLLEPSTEDLLARMQELAGVADLFEIRADQTADLDLARLLQARRRPLLFTCRPPVLGGRFPGDEARRRALLVQAAKLDFEYVDIEGDVLVAEVVAARRGRGLVLSHHDFDATPQDLDGLYRSLCGAGADVVKIAVTPRSPLDIGRLTALATRVGRSGQVPLVPIAMGPAGVVTRVAAGRYGAPFTYACAAPGAEAAAGQLAAALMADLYRVPNVGPATRIYGVLGADVAGSLSPLLHNRALAACAQNGVYVPLPADDLAAFVATVPNLGLSGFSVTHPYKSAILPLLGQVDPAAARCESVNTVEVKDGLLCGSTTDGRGVVAALRRHGTLDDRRVAILGAGGAARSAALALVQAGARPTLVARDAARAATAAAKLGCAHAAWNELPDLAWDVLVQATPVGTGDANASPLPARAQRPGTMVLDMVYQPLETRLLRDARAVGATGVDGLEMLVEQAALQFQAWTGQAAPLDVMHAAAETVRNVGAKREAAEVAP